MSVPWFNLLRGLLLFALLLVGACAEAEQKPVTGKVEWIYDGDTLKIAGTGKVRLIGIDTPEREDSQRDRSFEKFGVPRKNLRPTYQAALRFNIANVKNQTVTLTFDSEQRDRHDRTLAYVTLPDGRLLNRLLLEQGYALVYRRFDFRLKDDFLRAEATARERRVGLWDE